MVYQVIKTACEYGVWSKKYDVPNLVFFKDAWAEEACDKLNWRCPENVRYDYVLVELEAAL